MTRETTFPASASYRHSSSRMSFFIRVGIGVGPLDRGESSEAAKVCRMAHMSRPENWNEPADESSVRVSAGAPGSRPQVRGEIP